MVEIDIGPMLANWLSWHGLYSSLAVLVAIYLVGRWAPMRGVDPDTIYSIALWAVIGGIIGARLVAVIDDWSFYYHNPGEIIAIWKLGSGIWGGILGGFIGGTIYALWKKHPVGVIADLTAPAMLFVQTIGRLGDIVNGEHCARAADFALGFIWTNPESDARLCENGVGVSVQPTIAYEMVWNMLALLTIWKLRGRLKPDGMLFALYLALYAVGRLAISFAREDKVWAGGLREAQYISLIVLAITVPLLVIKARFTSRELAADGVTATVPRVSGTRAERRRRTRGR